MKLQSVELWRVEMPLVSPFRTSFGTQTKRAVLLVHVVSDTAEGWGECSALEEPVYSSEYIDGALEVMKRYLIPALLAQDHLSAAKVGPTLARYKGHRMAKAALELAILDCELRAVNMSFHQFMGGVVDKVPAGVSIGILDSIPRLLDVVGGYLSDGYLRIKLKIEPGWDIKPVAAVRERFGDGLLLQVDANAAYSMSDAEHLAKFDAFDLLLMEQPFDEDDVLAHARLAKRVRTPICLDESITSARSAADAIHLGACSIVNIKAARVGGYLEARRVHDVCAANGVSVWCGGMLETGLGRAANVALAALPGFTLPGDTSASDRFYLTDITEPFVLEEGYLSVPEGPGLGVLPLAGVLAELGAQSQTVSAR